MPIRNILWRFGIFYNHWVNFVFIWYIFSGFGIMCQEKSGNPGLKRALQKRLRAKCLMEKMAPSYDFSHSFSIFRQTDIAIQGDRIGRIFAQLAAWVLAYFMQWFENYRSSAHFWDTFSTVPVTYQF
jgi:hypothetical protein